MSNEERAVFGEDGTYLGRRESLYFDHVRPVLPDADESFDPLNDDINLLMDGHVSPEVPPETEDGEVECACDDDDCACVMDLRRFASPLEYSYEPRDYTDNVVPPQPGDESVPMGGGANTHRGVKCRRK